MAIKAKNMNTPPTMETNINADCAADNELFLLSYSLILRLVWLNRLSMNVVKFIFGSCPDDDDDDDGSTGVGGDGNNKSSLLLLLLLLLI